jgi:hypothetical protein
MTSNYALMFHMRRMFNEMENVGCFRSVVNVSPVNKGYQMALEAQNKEKKEQIDINRGLVSDFP